MTPTWQWAFIEKTSRFQRTSESDMAPIPRAPKREQTQSHGHGTSKERGPRNSCRSRNYYLSFGLIVTFARCGSFMTCKWVPPLKKFLKLTII
ncbi:hypothetical protein RJT34_25210 [Clitoria ternatea]|uniref:Uncharacterized protein n=1 Tax=Clitoria ternatea TaxID=43366 RepID=A0AAN9IGM7_CLITE